MRGCRASECGESDVEGRDKPRRDERSEALEFLCLTAVIRFSPAVDNKSPIAYISYSDKAKYSAEQSRVT